MLRAVLLSIVGVAAMGATAFAADLPARHSRIGAIFAERAPAAPPVRAVRDQEKDYPESALYRFRIPPSVPGYYGRPNDFYYRSYYEDKSAISSYFERLPYACGFYGYC
jgi:hypothetical protein